MRKILILVLAVCAITSAAFLWLRPASVRSGTSFLVIVVDSMRADHLGAYGYPRPTTPRLDALARDGVVFEQAFSQAPWTRPSVASIFTSTYISVHRVLYSRQTVDGEQRSDVLNEKFLTLAEAMKAGGYATGGFGQKIHLRPEFGFSQGFDGYDMHARRAESINTTALGWLRKKDPERFFLYLHYNDPHYPYRPRPEFAKFGAGEPRVQINGDTKKAFREGRLTLDDDDRRQIIDLYDGEILYTDHHVGEMIDGIGKLGYENLFIIVTADHGEEFLDHGDITHGHSLYSELVRVPFIVAGTALPQASRGTRLGTTQLIDIYPTLLEWANLPAPPGLQGTSISGLVRGDAPSARTGVYSERREPDERDFSEAAYEGRWKLIRDRAKDRVMLFDLESDPGETLRLEERNPEVVAGLTTMIEKWSVANRLLHDRIRPEETTPLDPETEQKLRSLGYIQ